MPKGYAYDLDTVKLLSALEIKKVGETTTTEVWKPAAEKRFRLAGFFIWVDTAATVVTLEDETTEFFVVGVEKTGAGTAVILPGQGYLSVKAGNKLKIKTSATNKFTATFYGMEDVA